MSTRPTFKWRVKRLHKDAKLPERATTGAACRDFCAYLPVNANGEHPDVIVAPGELALIGTGLAVAIPEDYELQIRPRSGLARKNRISVLNSPGTIDSDYRGEIGIMLINHGKDPFVVKHGERIAQGKFAIVPEDDMEEVESLDETARGAGGYGHTGR